MDITTGDLVFTCIGPMTDAISVVTRGYRSCLMNHVGVAVENQKGLFVLEAFPPEVRVTNWEVYARRTEFPPGSGQRRFLVGRLRPSHSRLMPAAIAYGLTLRDVPYDQLYSTDQGALYCSELVVDMFAYANGGHQFFAENPMSFRDPSTGEILQTWVEYYAYFGLEVPQGEPGSNPGDLSLDPRLEIIEIEGPIPGLS
ncbi:YiiX/YebB-like N1pC/P60 family cysteine hydrolase [Mesorhizobium ciceri]|uniref:YiiX/YebB-like N1pC/P60 family cysteine hydrolase n=1 Tax=Mesorhizobium TaxID=68287 RepID=UPI00047C3DE3|nr:YiiX/YebB-like N1pC/P60 family cysteine hydrolase [Mesorhizobium ciceri]